MPPTSDVSRAAAAFYKAHGLGNDYLVVDEGEEWPVTPGNIAAVCHRLRGVGSDGLILVSGGDAGSASGEVVARLRGFNPDGSEFERSGNGLRIAASHLLRGGRVGRDPFRVRIGGDRVEMEIHSREGGLYDISVAMGRALTGPSAVALDADALDPEGRLPMDGVGLLELTPVSVGNPHLVVWGQPLDPERLATVGGPLAVHAALRAGSNVQLAESVGPGRVRALIWERGVGPTTASGTSACAVAVSAVVRGLQKPGPLEVLMEGGRLSVTVSAELDVTLRGPVEEVMTGRMSPGFVQALPDPA